jgi:hypothetical protein
LNIHHCSLNIYLLHNHKPLSRFLPRQALVDASMLKK